MRPLLVATLVALLFVPAVGALEVGPGLPRVSECVELGCVQLQDNDANGSYEWANVAIAVSHAATLNANADDGVLLVQADASSEETVEPYHTFSTFIYANTTDEGVHEAWVFAIVLEGDEETGAQQQIAALVVEAHDTDGDGRPDALCVVLP